MNVYSELLELLTPERKDAPAGLFAGRGAVLSPRDGVP